MTHTPGPWEWFQRTEGEVYLATPKRGHLTVMDFVRLGMQKGQPRFATWKGDERENMGGIMVPATKLDISVHPDAMLIAAAPELLELAKLSCDIVDDDLENRPARHSLGNLHARLRAAIAKATGQ